MIEVIETFEYQIRLKQLNLQLFLDVDLPKEIKTDENRLKQILYNLLSNAIKFTETGYIKIFVSS